MSDETQPERGKPAEIDGPVVHPPVKPQVRPENLNRPAKRQPAPRWRSGDPAVIIEDMREGAQPGKADAD